MKEFSDLGAEMKNKRFRHAHALLMQAVCPRRNTPDVNSQDQQLIFSVDVFQSILYSRLLD